MKKIGLSLLVAIAIFPTLFQVAEGNDDTGVTMPLPNQPLPLASPAVRITEWMYDASEFIEFTNLGTTAIDFAGWSFDHNTRIPGSVSLSSFGLVAAGESVVLTNTSVEDFRAIWSLPSSVKVIGGNPRDLTRSDEINLYSADNILVDRLTFDDLNGLGPETSIASAWIARSKFSTSARERSGIDATLSSLEDSQGSYLSTLLTIGNPGTYAVPEPSTYALITIGLGLMIWQLRRRSVKAESFISKS